MNPEVLPRVRQSISEMVAKRTGLHFAENRWADLKRGLESAGKELGLSDVHEAAAHFLARQDDQEAIDLLAQHLTVGETYFFRDPHVFAALENEILPPLIHTRRQSRKQLRLWSAGCCTGEEPYSLAILLSKLLPDIHEWDITILATDINANFLRKAQSGVFTKWSFRGATEQLKRTYFSTAINGRSSLLPKYKSLVSFAYLNLVTDSYPSLVNNTNAMDVIICRNVMMYFTAPQMEKVVARLQESLVEGGWLIASPTEAGPVFAPLSPVMFSEAMLYRKIAAFPAEASVRRTLPPIKVLPERPSAPRREAATLADEKPFESSEDLAAAARIKADRGEFAEALKLCDDALAGSRLNASLYYLKGVILQEQGHLDEAINSLRKALYLDREFVLAYFTLGMIMRRKGDMEQQTKHFESALDVLKTYRPDDVISESAGITAGRLGEIIASTMELAHEI